MIKIICSLILLLTYGYSQDVNLKGKIVNENGIPLSVAVVTLANSGLTDTTNDDGTFHLLRSTPTGVIVKSTLNALEISDNTVLFSLSTAQKVSLTLSDLNGRELNNVHQGMLQEGMHAITLPLLDYSPGIYLVKLQMGAKSYISKVYSGLSQTKYRYPVSDSPSLLKTTAVEDTLVIFKNGYDTTKIAISSYVGGLTEIVLARSSVTAVKGMVLIFAKDASFQMGGGKTAQELPVHTVSFTRNFWMDETEVTQGEYSKIMKATFSEYFDPAWDYCIGPECALYRVNWADAILFCNAKSVQDGFDTVYSYASRSRIPGNGGVIAGLTADFTKNGYRLPTEAEWEYAARGGTTTMHYWGDSEDKSEMEQYAWYNLSSADADLPGPQPVGMKLPNNYGLYDMLGNVTEFCYDWFTYDYYAKSPEVDPIGPGPSLVPDYHHSMRGGNWSIQASHLRVHKRFSGTGVLNTVAHGFRTVRNE
ncbi:MAG: SUMF1/EgtB/PvdO family nonheme iron enzyme [Fibrobacteria bacterium]|nr:SUMF1/EgtB/PvdO family nonheme iron enzyme [Fibrobacteria bacterium]